MTNKNSEYYYIDINLADMKVVDWGEVSTANHTGETDDPGIHRAFLTKGQFNKLKDKLL